MKKETIMISMPKGSTQEEINTMRNKYKDKYKVNIIISGNNDPKDIIKNFLKSRLEV